MIILIIGSAHIDDDKRILDYIASFNLVREQNFLFDKIIILETISQHKIDYLENSGFEVFYSKIGNSNKNKGKNWMNHLGNFLNNHTDNNIFIFMSGRYMLQNNNKIKSIIDYMINHNIEFLAKDDKDLFEGKGVHTFLLFFKKNKFLEFINYYENNELNSPCIEHDLKNFLINSNNCFILDYKTEMGIMTNYYYSNINGIC